MKLRLPRWFIGPFRPLKRAAFDADPELEWRQRIARKQLERAGKHGDRERRAVVRMMN